MTAERPADVTALTEAEREALIEAIQNGTQDEWVDAIIAARVAAARAEGHEAGRAEVTAAVEALADDLAEYNPGHGDYPAAATRLRAALDAAAAPTLATVRADAGRDVAFGAGVEDTDFREFYIDDDAEAVGDDHA